MLNRIPLCLSLVLTIGCGGPGSSPEQDAGDEPCDVSVVLTTGKPVRDLIGTSPEFGQPAANLTDGNDETFAYPGAFQLDYEVQLENNYPLCEVTLSFAEFAQPGFVDAWTLRGVTDTGATPVLATGSVPDPVVRVPVSGAFHALRITASSQTNWIGIHELKAVGLDQPGLRHLGYYGVPTLAELAQLEGNANLIQTFSFDKEMFDKAGAIGVKLWVSNIYEEKLHGTCDALRADLTEWNAYAAKLEPYLANVGAIYLLDEPYLNMKANYNCTHDQIYYRLDDAAKLIKARFAATKPDLVIAVVETPDFVNGDLLFPPSIDWVGFDCYPTLYGGTFEACGGHSMREYVDILKEKLSPAQRIVIVPEGYVARDLTPTPPPPPTADEESKVAELSRQYIELALSEPRVVALMPFVGPHQQYTTATFFGVLEMPSVREIYRRLGATMHIK